MHIDLHYAELGRFLENLFIELGNYFCGHFVSVLATCFCIQLDCCASLDVRPTLLQVFREMLKIPSLVQVSVQRYSQLDCGIVANLVRCGRVDDQNTLRTINRT